MLKKILPVLKKTSAVFAAFLIFVSCLFVPSFASGESSTNSGDFYYSYWNLTKIYCSYSDGTFAVFDLPQTFYLTNSYYTQDLSLSSSFGGKSLEIQTYVGTTVLTSPSVALIFSGEGISNIQFIFEDSILKSSSNYLISSSDPDIVCPVFSTGSNLAISSFTGSYTSIRPMNGLDHDDYTFKFGSNSGSFGLTYVDDGSAAANQGYKYLALDSSILESEFDYYQSNRFTRIPYFSNIVVDIDFSVVQTSGNYNIGLALPLGKSSSADGSFNDVFDWYSRFFSGYKQVVSPTKVDFTSWIATAVGGFLRFELVPGISFSTLLFFMLGVGAVNIFLKFFAGG